MYLAGLFKTRQMKLKKNAIVYQTDGEQPKFKSFEEQKPFYEKTNIKKTKNKYKV